MKILKNILFFLVLIVICFMVMSCKSEKSDDENDYSDIYVFYGWYSKLLKCNVKTGVVTSVHTDPFCSHTNGDCPMNRIGINVFAEGNSIYFMKSLDLQEINQYNIYKYDHINDKISVIQKDIHPNDIIVIGDYLFFWNIFIQDDESMIYELTRYNMSNEKKDILSNDPNKSFSSWDIPVYYYHDDERIYWSQNAEIYSTNYDYADKRSEDVRGLVSGDYAYVYEHNYEKPRSYYESVSCKLYRKNMKNGDMVLLSEDLDHYMVVDDKIIYVVAHEDAEIVYKPEPSFGEEFQGNDREVGSNDGVYDHFKGKIYIVNTDGTDNRLLCEVPYTINYMGYLGRKPLIAGDYVGIFISDYIEQNEFTSNTSDVYGQLPNLLLVNYKTGEYKLTELKY